MFTRLAKQTHHGIAVVGALAVFSSPLTFDLGGYLDGLFGGSNSAPTKAEWRAMGNTHAPDRALRKGCHDYRYTYRVRPPDGTRWALEVFLEGPRGGGVASEVILEGADPRRGSKTFRICRANTTFGGFTIKGKLTYDDWPDEYSGWIKKSTFRLHRP